MPPKNEILENIHGKLTTEKLPRKFSAFGRQQFIEMVYQPFHIKFAVTRVDHLRNGIEQLVLKLKLKI